MGDKHALFVLLPKGETNPEVHSTLVYMGDPIGAPPSAVLCQVGQATARFLGGVPIAGYTMRYGMFGPEKDTPVVQLDGPMLYALYVNLSVWAKSEWGYQPHISTQEGYELPLLGTIIEFDRLGLWYGDERWAWRCGSGELVQA